jgi:hypothetical protein
MEKGQARGVAALLPAAHPVEHGVIDKGGREVRRDALDIGHGRRPWRFRVATHHFDIHRHPSDESEG